MTGRSLSEREAGNKVEAQVPGKGVSPEASGCPHILQGVPKGRGQSFKPTQKSTPPTNTHTHTHTLGMGELFKNLFETVSFLAPDGKVEVSALRVYSHQGNLHELGAVFTPQ